MVAAKILGGGTLQHHRCPRVTLPTKPYSTPSRLLYSQHTKIRAFSVRACGRADNDVRKRPIDGISIGDIAGKGSFKSYQAQKALQALAVDTNGRLQVWDDKNIALKLLSITFESLLEKGKMAMSVPFVFMRVLFWGSLATSSVVGLTLAICVALILRLFGLPASDCPVRKHVDTAFDAEFIEGFFSRAFGIGDPNQGIEEKRWKMIGQYIALNGSVVTAEEIAPYLDHETTGKMDDDAYMLPVLHKFDGQPKVDEEGNILYHFPSVHCTPLPRTSSRGKEYAGRWVDQDIQVDKFLEEHQFSKMDDESLNYMVFLLCYNLCCTFLWDFAVVSVTDGPYSLLSPPLFQMYAFCTVLFMVISFIRMSSIEKRNAEIVKRNEARQKRAKSLESPDLSLMRKLLSARTMARRASIGNDRIVYGSESDLYEQQDYELREWDQRFNRASGASIHP